MMISFNLELQREKAESVIKNKVKNSLNDMR